MQQLSIRSIEEIENMDAKRIKEKVEDWGPEKGGNEWKESQQLKYIDPTDTKYKKRQHMIMLLTQQ